VLFGLSILLYHNPCDRYAVNFHGLEAPACVME
jgi:hypothetical protein